MILSRRGLQQQQHQREIPAKNLKEKEEGGRMEESEDSPPLESLLNPDEYKVEKRIGEGTFSSVYSVIRKRDGKRLAVKRLIPTASPERILVEVRSLALAKGLKNVIPLEFIRRIRGDILLGMPFVGSWPKFGELILSMGYEEMKSYLKNLLVALSYIHELGIIHRDIKPANFLYDRRNKRYALCDFGLAQRVSPSSSNNLNRKRKHSGGGGGGAGSCPSSLSKRTALSNVDLNNEQKTPTKKSSINDAVLRTPPSRKSPRHSRQIHKECGARRSPRKHPSSVLHKRHVKLTISGSSIIGGGNSALNASPSFTMLDPTSGIPSADISAATLRQPSLTSRLSTGGVSSTPGHYREPVKCPCFRRPTVCSSCLSRRSQKAARAGTPGFRPPEVLLKYDHQTTAVDIWAIGVIMLCILSRSYPFFRAPDDATALAEITVLFGTDVVEAAAHQYGKNLLCDPRRPPVNLGALCRTLCEREPKTALDESGNQLPCNATDEAVDFLKELLNLVASNRLSAQDALEHPFLRGAGVKEEEKEEEDYIIKMPKRANNPVESGSSNPSSKKAKVLSAKNKEEPNFDNILSNLAEGCTAPTPEENLWEKKALNGDGFGSTSEGFVVEPGIISSESSSDGDEEEKEDEEEEKKKKNEGSKDVKIRIELPGKKEEDNKRRGKRGKYEAREERRRIKAVEFLIHRARVLCGISHLLYAGEMGNSDLLRGVALSVFPKAHLKDKPSIHGITSLLKWYRGASFILQLNHQRDNTNLSGVLMSSFQNLDFRSEYERVLGLYLLTLSAGWTVRLLYAPPENSSEDNRHWLEIFVEGRSWVIVDPFTGRSGDCSKELEKRMAPVLYVFAYNPDGTIKDLTPKYVQNYVTDAAKKRKAHEVWLCQTLMPYVSKGTISMEDREIEKLATEAPIPSSLSALKGHPLYVTPKHLGKLEVIHPPHLKPIGYIKRTEPIFNKKNVEKLRSKMSWIKEGYDIKEGERPRKLLKDKAYFGSWQTKKFEPRTAKEGKVPKNEYGNVELYQPWMLPKGTVHIPITGLNNVAKNLNIDFAPAVVGWEYHAGGSHPVVEGLIVCSEFQDLLMDAWNNHEDIKSTKEWEKRSLRILKNWKRLTKGLMLRERFKLKYKN